MSNYDDILHLPNHRSKKRSHMSMQDRAAQFSPFAALTGFETAIEETGRLTDCRTELEEYGKNRLDQAMAQLQELLPLRPYVMITYFVPDDRKTGGSYTSINGQLKKIDFYRQIIVFTDGTEIPLSDIIQVECSAFSALE